MNTGASEDPVPNPEGASWRLIYTKQAQKDANKLASSNLKEKAEELLAVLKENPYELPRPSMKMDEVSDASSQTVA